MKGNERAKWALSSECVYKIRMPFKGNLRKARRKTSSFRNSLVLSAHHHLVSDSMRIPFTNPLMTFLSLSLMTMIINIHIVFSTSSSWGRSWWSSSSSTQKPRKTQQFTQVPCLFTLTYSLSHSLTFTRKCSEMWLKVCSHKWRRECFSSLLSV